MKLININEFVTAANQYPGESKYETFLKVLMFRHIDDMALMALPMFERAKWVLSDPSTFRRLSAYRSAKALKFRLDAGDYGCYGNLPIAVHATQIGPCVALKLTEEWKNVTEFAEVYYYHGKDSEGNLAWFYYIPFDDLSFINER